MSEQEPEAASEGSIGQSVSTGGLGIKPIIGCIGHDGECCVNRENDLRDAARYRFIREAACDAAKLEALNKENKDPQTREEFDTAVDQAMSKFPNMKVSGAEPLFGEASVPPQG